MIRASKGTMKVQDVQKTLRTVKDPEIPVIDIVELGIVRDIKIVDENVEVTITPTYSGCPAMDTIVQDLKAALNKNYTGEVSIKTTFNPPWTTDWMWDSAKEKLRNYGIAPPCHKANTCHNISQSIISPNCPLCGSQNTKLLNAFSSTACKSIYTCQECLEPFDYFKPH